MNILKIKHLNRKINGISSAYVDDFTIDILFRTKEIFSGRDIYGKHISENIYIPFNNKNKLITFLNINQCFDELKKYYTDVIERQKKYINNNENYFDLELFIRNNQTNEYIILFDYRKYIYIKEILNCLCGRKNGILLDFRFYTINYNYLIERKDELIYILTAWVYPNEKTIDIEEINSFVNINANKLILQINELNKNTDLIINELINYFGKDYWHTKRRISPIM